MTAISRLERRVYAYIQPRAEQAGRPNRWQIGLWLALLAVTILIFNVRQGSYQVGIYIDDANYVVLAQSLLGSNAYGLANVPGDPAPTHWPFGFPLVLAPFVKLFPDAPNAASIISLLATLLNASLLFWGWPLLSRERSYWWGLTVAAVFTLSPWTLIFSQMVMSEAVFITCTLLTLILVEGYIRWGVESWPLLLLMGMLATLTIYVRIVGVSVLIALALRLVLFQRHRLTRLIGLAAGGLVFAALVVALTSVEFSDFLPSVYLRSLQPTSSVQLDAPEAAEETAAAPVINQERDPGLIGRIIENSLYYSQHGLRENLLPFGGGTLAGGLLGLVGLAITGLIVLGLSSFWADKGLSPSVFVHVLLFVGPLIIWRWWESRLIYPILPFLVYLLLWGVYFLGTLVRRVNLRLNQLPAWAVTLATVALLAVYVYKGIPTTTAAPSAVRDLQVGSDWLQQNAPPDAILMAQQPQSIYLYSRRKTIDYVAAETPTELLNILESSGVDYILVAPTLMWRPDGSLVYDNYTEQIFIPLTDELVADDRLKSVYRSEKDKVEIFEVVTDET